jgi:hypothetical protein
MLSSNFESKTSRDSRSRSESTMDSKSTSGFMDCDSKTCRNAKFKSWILSPRSAGMPSPNFESETLGPGLSQPWIPSPHLGSWIVSLRPAGIPSSSLAGFMDSKSKISRLLSPSFESKTNRDSRSESELIMDSKSESGFMDCDSETCRNAKYKSGFMDS